MNNLTTLGSSEPKPTSEQFQDLLQKYQVPKEEEENLLNEFVDRDGAGYTQEELEEIFDKYQVDITDRYNFSKANSKMREENLRRNAIRGAVAAIISRNMSHSI